MNKKIILIAVFLLSTLFLVSACTQYQRSQICGTHAETYTSNVKGCDGIGDCRCLHKAVLGLGACDSCECTKQVSDC